MPKRSSTQSQELNAKEEIMPFLRNLQQRLDKVEVAMEKIQLASNTEYFEDEQKIILTDSIVDEQITELLAGLREDLSDFIFNIFSPTPDISKLDRQIQNKIAELRSRITEFKNEIISEIIKEIKANVLQTPPSGDTKPAETKKPSTRKPSKKSTKKKRK